MNTSKEVWGNRQGVAIILNLFCGGANRYSPIKQKGRPRRDGLSTSNDRAYSRSDRFQLIRSPSVVLLLDEEDDEPELLPFGDFSRSL
jgi:hypothetical protein